MRFFLRLISNRPTFPVDITEPERKIMQEHAAYWKTYEKRGIAIVFGLVLDPKGPYGMGVVEVPDEKELQAITTNDPAVKAGLGHYEILPIR